MITMYTKNHCGYCMMAKALLQKHDVEYEEVNIDENEDARDYIISEGHRTMPQFYTDTGELFVEGGFQGLKDHFDKEKIDTAQLGEI